MKNKTITALLILMLIIPTQVFAGTSTGEDTKAGITPDSLFYGVDKLAESIQLGLIFSPEKKGNLLSDIAGERISESNAMIEAEKLGLGKKALQAYQKVLDKTSTYIDKTIEGGNDVTNLIDKVSKQINESNTVAQNIIGLLPATEQSDVKNKLNESIEKIRATKDANDLISDKVDKPFITGTDDYLGENSPIEAVRDSFKKAMLSKVTDEAFVDRALQNGLKGKQIITIKSLSFQTKKSLDDVLNVFLQNKKSVGSTIKALGLQPKEALKDINKSFKSDLFEVKEQFKLESKKHVNQTIKINDSKIIETQKPSMSTEIKPEVTTKETVQKDLKQK